MTATAGPARAGLVVRLAALLYEALLVTALVFIVGFVMLPLVSPHASGDALTVPPLFARVALFCVVFAVLAAYFTWSWSEGRQTLAQKSWRIVLVRSDGAAVDRRTALARYLAGWIGPALSIVAFLLLHPRGLGAHAAWLVAFNFAFALIDPERQFLHDRIARTQVLKQASAAKA